MKLSELTQNVVQLVNENASEVEYDQYMVKGVYTYEAGHKKNEVCIVVQVNTTPGKRTYRILSQVYCESIDYFTNYVETLHRVLSLFKELNRLGFSTPK